MAVSLYECLIDVDLLCTSREQFFCKSLSGQYFG